MSGITAIPLATVIATILSIDGNYARVDAGLVEGIRPDDTAVVYYMTPIGAEEKKVIVNRGVVIEVDEHSSVLRVDSEFTVLPGYSAEFEIPMGRVSPLSILDLARSRLVANRANEDLGALIEVLVPEDEEVEQQVVSVIQERWRKRGNRDFSTGPTVSEEGGTGATEAYVDGEMASLVRSWAQAWSDQRVDDYLASYSSGYLPPGGMPRDRWQDQRRQRITRPRFIKLSLVFLESERISDSRGSIQFSQSYWSDTYRDTVTKRLELIRDAGGWQILQESTVD